MTHPEKPLDYIVTVIVDAKKVKMRAKNKFSEFEAVASVMRFFKNKGKTVNVLKAEPTDFFISVLQGLEDIVNGKF